MDWEQIYERWERKVRAEGYREGQAESRRQGKAEGLLGVLEGRGLTVTAAHRKLVLACTEDAQFDAWLRAAATTPSADALLSEASVRRPRHK